jgi:hypothetical protein
MQTVNFFLLSKLAPFPLPLDFSNPSALLFLLSIKKKGFMLVFFTISKYYRIIKNSVGELHEKRITGTFPAGRQIFS